MNGRQAAQANEVCERKSLAQQISETRRGRARYLHAGSTSRDHHRRARDRHDAYISPQIETLLGCRLIVRRPHLKKHRIPTTSRGQADGSCGATGRAAHFEHVWSRWTRLVVPR
jgi:hypothetical protein